MKMTTSGLHDGFPGYEMFVSRPNANEADKKLVYGFDPRTVGNTPLALAGEIFGQQVISTQTTITPTTSSQPTERKQQ